VRAEVERLVESLIDLMSERPQARRNRAVPRIGRERSRSDSDPQALGDG
jgi:hypothetical protein